MIRAYRTVERLLGPDSDGAVITRGSDAKFWCTVCVASYFSQRWKADQHLKGLELDEADTNPFANTDGFYPVCDLKSMIQLEQFDPKMMLIYL
jgi:hypothetical protein